MKRRGFVVAVAGVLVALALTPAAAADRQRAPEARDHRPACERLADVAQSLRARIGDIQSLQERIRQTLASGELRPAQEARARHALRTLEALQQELEAKLARVLAVYQERCTR